jgi:hypothetical protein
MHVGITELVGFADGDDGRMRAYVLEHIPEDTLGWLYTQSTSELREAVSKGDHAQAARYAIAALVVTNVLHASMDQQHAEGTVSDDDLTGVAVMEISAGEALRALDVSGVGDPLRARARQLARSWGETPLARSGTAEPARQMGRLWATQGWADVPEKAPPSPSSSQRSGCSILLVVGLGLAILCIA